MSPDRIIHPKRPDKPWQRDPWGKPVRISGGGESSPPDTVIGPDGNEVLLSESPPRTVGGVTAEQLHKSADRGSSGIEKSQPSGDRR